MVKKAKTQDQWSKDEYKPYLWIHNEQPIQAMIFTCDNDRKVKCMWVKILHNDEFVSNYFVYSQDVENVHPLDFVVKMVEKFREEIEKKEEVCTSADGQS